MRTLALLLSLSLGAAIVAASPVAYDQDTIVSMFNKTKDKSKTKHGVTWSRYVEVRAAADTKSDPAAYSGTYAADFGYTFELDVARDGTVRGKGRDEGAFTLRNARVRGAMITGTKVYSNGSEAPLHGAFIRRTTREGTSRDNINSTHTATGLGVVGVDFRVMNINVTKVFYEAE
jgi:hypothetical protein